MDESLFHQENGSLLEDPKFLFHANIFHIDKFECRNPNRLSFLTLGSPTGSAKNCWLIFPTKENVINVSVPNLSQLSSDCVDGSFASMKTTSKLSSVEKR